jgi:1-acyl-sn-glycerol-3-phosphate acyltransferase
MFVANHISWADIIAVAAVVDTDFVAKADVAAYPGIGALAGRTGTIFVERERRSQAGSQMEAIRQRLIAGRRVLMFPEGTTSDGRGLLPFRSSLFAAADAAVAVQPVTIRYTAPGGGPLDPAALDAIAWIGDEDMLPNALALARQRAGVVLHFHDPVEASAFETRKALAEHCRAVMLRHYLP